MGATDSKPTERGARSSSSLQVGSRRAGSHGYYYDPMNGVGSPERQSRGLGPGFRPTSPSTRLPREDLDGELSFGLETVPLHVDARSVLYSDYFLPDPSAVTASAALASAEDSFHLHSRRDVSSMALEEFDLGVPAVPLTNSCIVSVPQSGFLVTPQYNQQESEAAEEIMCHSPVLRSYHEAFPTTNQSPALSLQGSVSGSLGAGAMNAGGGVSTSFGATGASTSMGRHNRFLEIAGDPIGLDNYGNTCYINSVVQLIYHCAPLRLRLLELYDAYKARRGSTGFEENTVLFAFCQLIYAMHKANNTRKREDGKKTIAPKPFILRVSEKNPFFRNEQQDAHEFCMFLLNDIMEAEKKIMDHPKNARYFREEHSTSKFALFSSKSSSASKAANEKNSTTGEAGGGAESLPPLQAIMQGKFCSLTACLQCHSITMKREAYLDLSLETRQGCSLLDCLTHYGDPSLFVDSNKLKCQTCKKSVNAANTMHVEKLPQFALLIHLKRFRYDPEKKDFAKTAHHVALPMEMDVEEYKLEEQKGKPPADAAASSSAASDKEKTGATKKSSTGGAKLEKVEVEVPFTGIPADIRKKLEGVAHRKARFELTGFVAHVGDSPSVGHYFTCTRYGPNLWRRFDDDVVTTMTRREVQQLFGVPIEAPGVLTTTAYILLYERVA